MPSIGAAPPQPPLLWSASLFRPVLLLLPLAACCCCSAAAVFFYLHMDCLDGKQARRTKNSSPLGQLFDHGGLVGGFGGFGGGP